MLQATKRVNGATLWANMFLLFWLSLIPFATDWLGKNHLARGPITVYGTLLLLCGTSYYILSKTLIAADGQESKLAQALGSDAKGIASLIIYAAGIAVSTFTSIPSLAFWFYIAVALMWLIPDRRIEKQH